MLPLINQLTPLVNWTVMFSESNLHLNLKLRTMQIPKGHIAITDPVHPYLTDRLNEAGIPFVYRPDCVAEEIPDLLDGALGLVIRSKAFVNKTLLGKNRPAFIARAGSGMDNLDEDALIAMGIHLINAPEGNRDAVAEQTIGMLLNLSANITKANNEIKSGIWDREGNRGFEIAGKTIGIVGYGNCGSAVAKKLSGFGATLLVYDKYLSGYGNKTVVEAEMDDLFEQADVVTYHIPLTGETEGMINGDYIRKFKKDIVLLNLSRGKIMKTGDLIPLLEEGKVKALALDVLENENIQKLSGREKEIFTALSHRENVIITPHVGGWTEESYRKISEILVNKIFDFLSKTKKNAKEVNEIAGKV